MTTKKEFNKLSEEERYWKIRALEANLKKLRGVNTNKDSKIRSMTLRIKSIIRQLEYTLEHPYSIGESMKGRKLKK